MDILDFYDHVEKHEDLKGVSIHSEDGVNKVVVQHIPTQLKTELSFETVQQHTWDDLCAVLEGRREPYVLYHMTRVVGYYSRVENWNQSKIGELEDRQAGNYNVAV